MDRFQVYPGAIPQETDILRPQRAALEALAWLTRSVMGDTAAVEGLTVGPASPAAMSVVVQPGAIYMPMGLDANAFSTLPPDSHSTMQQGLLRDAVQLALTPPSTSGQSRVYLVQAACSVVDTDPTTLPYYNAVDPTTAFSGPGNSGTPQNTRRAVQAVISLKPGVAAATGSEVAPALDAGNVELARVTVANGASTISGGQIAGNASLRRKVAALPDLIDTLRPLFGSGRRFYIGATQSITAPAWATKVHLRMWAAGGGGGACTGSFSGGAGGGGGEFREGELPVTGGASYLATIGAGGAGGTGFSNGSGGGNSGFGSLMTAIAGGGGSGSNGTFASVSGTPGSGGGGGSFPILPGPAGTPFAIGANTVPGLGGAAFCTSMNALTVTNTNTNGLPGIFPAGGGNGGSNGGAGGIGAAGFIIGEWLP